MTALVIGIIVWLLFLLWAHLFSRRDTTRIGGVVPKSRATPSCYRHSSQPLDTLRPVESGKPEGKRGIDYQVPDYDKNGLDADGRLEPFEEFMRGRK